MPPRLISAAGSLGRDGNAAIQSTPGDAAHHYVKKKWLCMDEKKLSWKNKFVQLSIDQLTVARSATTLRVCNLRTIMRSIA